MTSASAEASPYTSGCPLRERAARQDQRQDQREPAGCDPREATADSAAASASRCPVDHHHDPSASSSPFLNPLNNIPAGLSQQPSPGQKTKLPTERTVSSIPRGRLSAEESSKPQAEGEVRGGEAYGLGAKWEYPSPQQFYNALKRKGWETPEEHVDTMVDIHNFLNEGAWEQVLEWEKAHDRQCCEPRSLLKFQGRPKDLTPKARLMMWLYGSPRPFDRHDWIVDRCGQQVRYIIDYYSAPEEAGNAPAFHLDVRPALDSPQAFLSRTKAGFWKAYERFTGRSCGNVPR